LATPGGVAGNLALWLKADAGIDESNGQAVDQWDDHSGSSNNVTQLGTTEYADDGINYNPAVNTGAFGAANNGAFSVPDISGAVSDQMSWYMVYHPRGDTNYNVLGSVDSPGHVDRSSASGGFSFIGITAADIGSRRFNSVSKPSATDPQIVRYNHKVIGNELDFAINGDAGSLSQNSTAFSNIKLDNLRVGNSGTTGVYLDGQVAEIIVYADEQTTGTSRQQIESYLAIKYGITLDQNTATDYLASDGTTLMWDAITICKCRWYCHNFC